MIRWVLARRRRLALGACAVAACALLAIAVTGILRRDGGNASSTGTAFAISTASGSWGSEVTCETTGGPQTRRATRQPEAFEFTNRATSATCRLVLPKIALPTKAGSVVPHFWEIRGCGLNEPARSSGGDPGLSVAAGCRDLAIAPVQNPDLPPTIRLTVIARPRRITGSMDLMPVSCELGRGGLQTWELTRYCGYRPGRVTVPGVVSGDASRDLAGWDLVMQCARGGKLRFTLPSTQIVARDDPRYRVEDCLATLEPAGPRTSVPGRRGGQLDLVVPDDAMVGEPWQIQVLGVPGGRVRVDLVLQTGNGAASDPIRSDADPDETEPRDVGDASGESDDELVAAILASTAQPDIEVHGPTTVGLDSTGVGYLTATAWTGATIRVKATEFGPDEGDETGRTADARIQLEAPPATIAPPPATAKPGAPTTQPTDLRIIGPEAVRLGQRATFTINGRPGAVVEIWIDAIPVGAVQISRGGTATFTTKVWADGDVLVAAAETTWNWGTPGHRQATTELTVV